MLILNIQKLLKRLFDFLMAIILLILTFPFILIALLVVKIKSPDGSPIFVQTRIGFKNKEFNIYKIRSMTNDKDIDGNLLPSEQRLKTWGKVIRKLNIDELLQILNILKGEMSFIGPRPLLKDEMQVMSEDEQKVRQSVLPGITGWEAVNEEKTTSRRLMAEYDLYYVRKWSLWFDIKILFKTIIIIFTFRRPDDEHRAPKLDDSEINK